MAACVEVNLYGCAVGKGCALPTIALIEEFVRHHFLGSNSPEQLESFGYARRHGSLGGVGATGVRATVV